MRNLIIYLISYFKPQYLCTVNDRDFYYKRKLGEKYFHVYMHNIHYYDRSGYDYHTWNFVDKGLLLTNLSTARNIIAKQESYFFQYNTYN